MYPKIHIKSKLKKMFFGHKHPWVFSGAIERIEENREELHGQLASIYLDGEFLAHGYYNNMSQIAFRVLSWNEDEKIDYDFFVRKISTAFEMRKQFVLNENTTACRIIFAESDFLPGFIVDKYNDLLVLQIHTLGAETLKEIFVKALIEVLDPKCVYEKSDVGSRKLEGLKEHFESVLFGDLPEKETILEHGLKFQVNAKSGQKTGFFLDQRENRHALEKYCKDKKILNICGYTGGFSVAALRGGACHVTTVDTSESAIAGAIENVKLNGFSPKLHEGIAADAFDYLYDTAQNSFDLIVLDPPAFVKSKKDMERGLKGYISLNQLALQSLDFGGLLMTCSCSSLVSDEHFLRMLSWASQSAGCLLQVVEKLSQPADHPLTPYFPEGSYLKCYIVRKVEC